MGIWTKIRCKIGAHKRLDVIQSFGAGKHIGCPDCGKQMAIHTGERVIVDWDDDFSEMYESMGYDIAGPLRKWKYIRLGRTNTGE